MKKIIAAILLATVASSSAYAAKADDFTKGSEKATCESSAIQMSRLREAKDIEEGYKNIVIQYMAFYLPASNKCFAAIIEVYKHEDSLWLRRSVIDPVNRELFALFKSNTAETDMICEFKIDGVRAHCLDSDDFDRLARDNLGINTSLPKKN